MTESQNAQARATPNTTDSAPAQEDQAFGRAHPSQPPPDLPPPSGGDAGPSAKIVAKTNRSSRSATIGSDAEREAKAAATPLAGAPLATSSAKAEPIASDQSEPMQITRSATNSPAKVRPKTRSHTRETTRANIGASPIRQAPASTNNSGPAGSVSGHENREPQARPAADSNPPASDGGDGGQRNYETQNPCAAVNLPSGDGGASGHVNVKPHRQDAARKPKRRQAMCEIHTAGAAPGGDGDAMEITEPSRLAHPVTALLIPMVRRHSQWHAAWMRLVLQGRAIGRGAAGGDKKAGSKLYDDAVAGTLAPEHFDLAVTLRPLIIATERLATEVAAIDKAIEKAAKTHPLWPWAKEVYGIGPGSLGKLIAQAHSPAIEDRDGNPRTPAFEISDYRSVAGLWKRFGLAVINGERQRMKSGIEGIEHAYAPRRRALMWNVGGGLIGFMQKGPRPLVGEDVEARDDLSPYQKLFVARLRSEAERDPAMRLPDAIKDGIAKESYKTHASNRARRYVEKRFLRHLYAAAQAVAGRGQGMHEAQRGAAAPQSKFG